MNDRHRDVPGSIRPDRRRLVAGGLVGWLGLGVGGRAEAAYVVKPWPTAKPVPALELADLDGRPWRLESVAGRVVLLNFWATWCEPCRTELPSLAALAEKHRKAGLSVVAVNYREPAPKIRSFLEASPWSATMLLDADGDATTDWTPRVFPSTVILGRDGRPIVTVVGGLDWGSDEATRLLAPLLAAGRKRG